MICLVREAQTNILGSARTSRAGDGALAIANFGSALTGVDAQRQSVSARAPKHARESACAPQKQLQADGVTRTSLQQTSINSCPSVISA